MAGNLVPDDGGEIGTFGDAGGYSLAGPLRRK